LALVALGTQRAGPVIESCIEVGVEQDVGGLDIAVRRRGVRAAPWRSGAQGGGGTASPAGGEGRLKLPCRLLGMSFKLQVPRSLGPSV
jgi:hypothetical protein